MTNEDLLEITEQSGDGKIIYRITELGRAEFMHRLMSYWEEVKPIVDPFMVALTFMDRLPPLDLAAAMKARAAQLQLTVGMTDRALGGKKGYGAPRHIDECLRLTTFHLQAQLTWVNQAIDKIKNGSLP